MVCDDTHASVLPLYLPFSLSKSMLSMIISTAATASSCVTKTQKAEPGESECDFVSVTTKTPFPKLFGHHGLILLYDFFCVVCLKQQPVEIDNPTVASGFKTVSDQLVHVDTTSKSPASLGKRDCVSKKRREGVSTQLNTTHSEPRCQWHCNSDKKRCTPVRATTMCSWRHTRTPFKPRNTSFKEAWGRKY